VDVGAVTRQCRKSKNDRNDPNKEQSDQSIGNRGDKRDSFESAFSSISNTAMNPSFSYMGLPLEPTSAPMLNDAGTPVLRHIQEGFTIVYTLLEKNSGTIF